MDSTYGGGNNGHHRWDNWLVMVMVGSAIFGMKVSITLALFLWVRGTYPRVRYDQLMHLLWKSYLPLTLGGLCLVSGIVIGMGGLVL